MIKVSIYIPTKNRLDLLKRAINSVRQQTYSNIELIVVDDGSTDGTVDYLHKQLDGGTLKAIFNPESKGACFARNQAILAASGYFVTGLDDDDYFTRRDRIELFVNEWSRLPRKPAGLFDSVTVLTPRGSLLRHQAPVVTYNDLRRSNLVGSQIFAPKMHFIDSGLFDPLMPAWQDWDLWLRVSKNFGNFVNINKNSYEVDENHGGPRITQKDPEAIRFAMRRLSEKIPDLTLREKSSLMAAMLAYPQVKPTLAELSMLVVGLKIRSLHAVLRRILF